jgi:molecular chaperone DnaK
MHAAEDEVRRGEIETRNMADSLAYTAEKTLRDNADKISDELKTEVEGKVAAVRTALEGSDKGAIDAAVAELNASMQKIGEAVYGAQGAGGPEDGAGPDAGEAPEGTVEGEFREV